MVFSIALIWKRTNMSPLPVSYPVLIIILSLFKCYCTLLWLFAFHLQLPLTYLSIGALFLVSHFHSALCPLTTTISVASNTLISFVLAFCMFSKPAFHLTHAHSYIYIFCVFYSIPILLCIYHLNPCFPLTASFPSFVTLQGGSTASMQ